MECNSDFDPEVALDDLEPNAHTTNLQKQSVHGDVRVRKTSISYIQVHFIYVFSIKGKFSLIVVVQIRNKLFLVFLGFFAATGNELRLATSNYQLFFLLKIRNNKT